MSAWVLGLALSAGFLMNKNFQTKSRLIQAESEYQGAAEPATDGVTSEEVRKSWRNTDFARFGDYAEDLDHKEKLHINRLVEQQHSAVESFEGAHASSVPIQGVLMDGRFD